MGALDLRGRVVISDGASATLRTIKGNLDAVGGSAQKLSFGHLAGNHLRSAAHHMERLERASTKMGLAAFAGGAVIKTMVTAAKEFNDSIWGANAAFLSNDKNAGGEVFKNDAERLADARLQAVKLRDAAMELSKKYGLLPETFSLAGEEAAKMGLNFAKSKAIMAASGLVQMSDREAKANDVAKALGTYGIVYGSPADDTGYGVVAKQRASMLALAGAETRTSASKIEEGSRNYMGIHGAFGGKFEDMVALIAVGSNLGQMEKETGTALKSFQGRMINMPVMGRAALAGASINMSDFMDFGAADPLRATNQIIQSFPQQLKKNARGELLKHFENARSTGELGDPSIINKTVAKLESLGMKFSGDDDRTRASDKLAAILTGAGGKFDPIGAYYAVHKAVKEGRATSGIWASMGEPKRMHQNSGLEQNIEKIIELRDKLRADKANFIDLIGQGYSASEAGNVMRLEAAFRRLQITLTNSAAIQNFVATLGDIAAWAAQASEGYGSLIGSVAAGAVALALAGTAVGFLAKGLRGLALLLPTAALATRVVGSVAPAAAAVTGAGFLAGVTAQGAAAAAAGAAGAGAGAAGRGMLARAGSYFIPGVGWVLAGASLAGGAYGAYDAYSKGGTGWDVAKGFGIGAATFGLAGTSVQAAPGMAPDGVGGGPAAAMESETMAAIERMRASLAGVDFTSEGQRIGESLAAGLRTGLASAVAAIDEAGGQMRAAASRIQLNTGTAMGAAR